MKKETNNDLAIKKAVNGRGVFARRNFAAGEDILAVEGTLITCYEDDDLDEETRSNTYRYDEELFLNPGKTVGNYLNHSCEPNAKVEKRGKRLHIVALMPIKRGSEIVFDYSTILAKDDFWKMQCNCGSALCRGTIKRFATLPKKLQRAYIEKGIVPQYILDIDAAL